MSGPLTSVAVYPVIFLGELPDKTMFASLVLSTRGRPAAVWLGAAAAFAVHVVIATTIGVAAVALLPHRALEALVALLFLGGAVFAWREGAAEEEELIREEQSRHGVMATAFLVIFIAEWGDLTQILTANLAARYHDALAVGVGATLALWSVAGVAVVGGQTLLRFVPVVTVRKLTSFVLLAFAVVAAVGAAR